MWNWHEWLQNYGSCFTLIAFRANILAQHWYTRITHILYPLTVSILSPQGISIPMHLYLIQPLLATFGEFVYIQNKIVRFYYGNNWLGITEWVQFIILNLIKIVPNNWNASLKAKFSENLFLCFCAVQCSIHCLNKLRENHFVNKFNPIWLNQSYL